MRGTCRFLPAGVLAALLLLVVGPGLARAADFSGKIEITRSLIRTTGTIQVRGKAYRMDLTSPDGPDLVILADPDANKTRVLVPRYRLYVEMACDDPMSRASDPFQGLAALRERGKSRTAGAETIEGHECTREVLSFADTPAMEVWVAKDLGFPLKILDCHDEDAFTRISGIEMSEPDPALFEVPEGYGKSTFQAIGEKLDADPEIQAKRAAWKKTRLRRLELRKDLSVGCELRVLAVPGTKIRAKVEHGRTEPFSWFVVPASASGPLRERAKCAHDGPGRVRFDEVEGTDRIVAGATKGEASLTLTLVGRSPVVLAISEEFRVKEREGRMWSPRPNAELVRITITADSKKATGRLTVQTGAGPSRKKETVKFDLAPGATKSFEYTKKEGVTDYDLTVDSGMVKARVLQDGRPEGERKPF